MRTEEEIQREIAWLKENKENVQRITYFGDNNHAAIEAQIHVLEVQMDEDEAESEYESERSYTQDHAVHAAQWMYGDDEYQPSSEDNWGFLAKKE